MDDTTCLLDSLEDVQTITDRQQLVGMQIHLHTSNVKLIGVVASIKVRKLCDHHPDITAGGGIPKSIT